MDMDEPQACGPPARQLPDQLRAVGPGWHSLLLRLHEQLLLLDPGYQLDDLKEKLGGVRIRIVGTSAPACADARALVAAAEEQSATICEFCGASGRRRTRSDTKGGWIKAVCDDCHRAWSNHTIVIINGSVHNRETGRR
ncbi:hypothetical protein [Streptomyces sp. NPDC002619]|uniref:hypothetical protein n=1 Tax=Streptomyces sp. NPDC002619 TaxID=3364655 RepID=UPI00367675CD